MRHEAIRLVYPDAKLIDGESEVWDYDGNSISIDESKVSAKQAELKAAYNALAYARSRKKEYPPWGEQLDHIYHNGIASWKANMVKPVKDKYPKP